MKWLPWLVFALFGFYLVGNNFSAKLGLIDDHEVALFLGSKGKIEVTEIPRLVDSTEIGQYGHALRYRPVYYTLRIVETAIWRDNAQLWYGMRYVLLVLSMVILWKIVAKFFPQIIAYLFVFALFTLPFWPDILTRLGPSEIYAVPALMLFVYGFIKMWQGEREGLWQTCLGYIICVGSKENFLILLPILLLLFSRRLYQRRVSKEELIAYIVCILFTLLIGTEVVIATKTAGVDIYGTQISYLQRIKTLYAYKRYIVETRHLQFVIVAFFGGILLFLANIRKVGISKTWRSSLTIHLLLLGIIAAVVASQSIFYNNALPTNGRYDFPGIPLFSVLNLVAFHMIISLLPLSKKVCWIKGLLYLGLAGYLIYIILGKGYNPLRNQARNNAVITSVFAQKLDLTANVLRQNPDIPLVMISRNYLNFEPIVSLSRYLTSRGVTNVIMLDYTSDQDASGNALDAELSPRLVAVEENGSTEPIFARFTPLSMLKRGQSCYSISFDEAFPTGCVDLATY